MIGWLLATAGTALLGSVFPLANIELYLVGVLTQVDGLNWWALALAAAIGQMAGKTLFFLAGRGGFSLGTRLGRMTEARKGGRWAVWLEKFHDRTQQHPWWGLGVLFVSAVLSFPPFTVLCFLSGAAGLPLLGFLTVSLIGRAIHFLIVAGAPELIHQLPFFG
ncbi:VTT domain-containing protein [Saccharopolyspora gloriosae]|uniref:VTT domain-containing protein n=1 Tax=Saccharopolyspora gloriosae TaxID=455344 RepID=UPI001FB6BA0E|nr:VTT domain-containing protein [Saccharopolyspora gloriosae]